MNGYICATTALWSVGVKPLGSSWGRYVVRRIYFSVIYQCLLSAIHIFLKKGEYLTCSHSTYQYLPSVKRYGHLSKDIADVLLSEYPLL